MKSKRLIPVAMVVAIISAVQLEAKPVPKLPPKGDRIEKAIIGEWRGISATSGDVQSKFDALWRFHDRGDAVITQEGKAFGVKYKIRSAGALAQINMSCLGSSILTAIVRVEKDTLSVSYVAANQAGGEVNVTLIFQRVVVAKKEP